MLFTVLCAAGLAAFDTGKERTNLEIEHLALDFDHDLSRKVSLGDGARDICNRTYLLRQVDGHEVDVVGERLVVRQRPREEG